MFEWLFSFSGMVCLILSWILWKQKSKYADLWEKYKNQAQDIQQSTMREEQYRTRLELLQQSSEEKVRLLQETKEQLDGTLKSLCNEALQMNSSHFLDLAKTTFEQFRSTSLTEFSLRDAALQTKLTPLQDLLQRFDGKMDRLEQERVGNHHSLLQQIQTMVQAERTLSTETGKLVQALRAPQARGRWGELQLRKVVELSGMVEHCDFSEQVTYKKEDQLVRPDMVVRLPGNKVIIVDAKTPLDGYLAALECNTEEERNVQLERHARHVKTHIDDLAKKGYCQLDNQSPEFVILFLPGEMFFSAALQKDPNLLEYGAVKGVLLATPTTLIAMLRSVAYGWKQDNISQQAQKISQCGHELYKRLSDLSKHWNKLGKQLSLTVKTFNQASGSLEARVLPAARKLKELHVHTDQHEIEEVPVLEENARMLTAAELQVEDLELAEEA